MYKNLMAEVDYLKEARGYGTLEAIRFIEVFQKDYASEVRRELREFMMQGAQMFAPKEPV